MCRIGVDIERVYGPRGRNPSHTESTELLSSRGFMYNFRFLFSYDSFREGWRFVGCLKAEAWERATRRTMFRRYASGKGDTCLKGWHRYWHRNLKGCEIHSHTESKELLSSRGFIYNFRFCSRKIVLGRLCFVGCLKAEA